LPFSSCLSFAEHRSLTSTGLYRGYCLAICPSMEAPMERMPIACVHCAKAKAKCDKKVCRYFTSSPSFPSSWQIWHFEHCIVEAVLMSLLILMVAFEGSLLSVRHEAGVMPVEANKKVIEYGLTSSSCFKTSSRERPFLSPFPPITYKSCGDGH
jgi:hypothetical protein